MAMSFSLFRGFFFLLTIFLSIAFSVSYFGNTPTLLNVSIGLLAGFLISFLLIALETLCKKVKIQTFNTVALGLLFGLIMGKAILFVFDGLFSADLFEPIVSPARYFIYLCTSYLGIALTLRSADELHSCIPYISLKATGPKKKDILADVSVLHDPRIIELASTGLLDHQLIFPQFLIKELYIQSESEDESIRSRARRGLEVLKKLEGISSLNLRFTDMDFPEVREHMVKLVRLARSLDTNIITSDMTRIQQSSIEGVMIINIHQLSQALKPITHPGEIIQIKIQRPGRESRQGVGYLDDGTMVVVNGAEKYIERTIRANVLSVKQTQSGRMIFCNAMEDEDDLIGQNDPILSTPSDLSMKSYMSI